MSSESASCLFCRERWQEQRRVMRRCQQTVSAYEVCDALELPHGIRGIGSLKELHLPAPWFTEEARRVAAGRTGSGGQRRWAPRASGELHAAAARAEDRGGQGRATATTTPRPGGV